MLVMYCRELNVVRPDGRAGTKIQLEDLLRHSGQSRKSQQKSSFHMAAVAYDQQRLQPAQPAEEDPAERLGVTPCQIWIATQIVHTPTSAQAQEFARRCEAQYKTSPEACPLARSGPKTHWKILQSVSDVLFQRDRAVVLGGIRAVGLVQDCRHFRV